MNAQAVIAAGRDYVDCLGRVRRRTDPVERFMEKIDRSAGDGGCWLWTLVPHHSGYGLFQTGHGQVMAHRFSYELHVGPIPEGLQLDHLCRVRHCVNPAHLEPVTQSENVRRGYMATRTHCKNGHPFDEANTRLRAGRGRTCRACDRERQRKAKARRLQP